jgi:hypothetical protein
MTKNIECKVCGEVLPRMSMFTDQGKRYFVHPETKLMWLGRTCPECIAMGDSLGEHLEKLTGRKCRDCGCFLTQSRYFKCHQCQPTLPSMDDEYIYEAEGIDPFTESMAECWDGSQSEEEDYENLESEEAGQEGYPADEDTH